MRAGHVWRPVRVFWTSHGPNRTAITTRSPKIIYQRPLGSAMVLALVRSRRRRCQTGWARPRELRESVRPWPAD
eukprot:12739752-Alexandrium_andersonii.AAC.1